MDVRNQGNPPARPATAAPASRRPDGLVRALLILVTILVICALGFAAWRGFNLLTGDSAVKSKQYQALFLTNGQVYFGHLTQINSGYVKLTDIYYLQVQQQVQPGQSSSSSSAQQVSLAKLGNELHGPEDMMYVSRGQVLFWENLKNSGKVVTAITNYQNQHK